jgi:exodeoxyribonuclease-1
MSASFFFYDLETSGISPREQRIMQFAGQRTNSDLEPIGEPVNILIKLTPDVVPDPEAVLLTGITPQSTQADGLTEAEFLKYFYDEIVTPDTCFLGYNTVRFDDEFMRFLHYRNFYDPYEWQWSDNCSRWDILDVVRMTRALRPDGIEWPMTDDGKPTNRLELLTKVNNLDHYAAHDALSDVYATIAIAKLVRDKQQKLFDFLFDYRGKKKIIELVCANKPFVYSSGKFSNDYEKTTVCVRLAEQPQNRGSYVYDLRHDPTEFMQMTPAQLVERWQYTRDEAAPKRLPVKLLQYNHCPAIAPGFPKDEATQKRLGLDEESIGMHLALLHQHQEAFAANILEAVAIMDKQRDAVMPKSLEVDAQLYDGFIGSDDKQVSRAIRAAKPESINDFGSKLRDERLKKMLPLYKARNYPSSLTGEERTAWEDFCRDRLMSGGPQARLAKYFERLQEIAASNTDSDKGFLLEELQLYGQSVLPAYEDA